MNHKLHNLCEGNRLVPSGYSSWLDYWEQATGFNGYGMS